jgi:hypothetical protein
LIQPPLETSTSLDQQFRAGIRKLDEEHADYLYQLRQELPSESEIGIGSFVYEMGETGSNTLVFLHLRGRSLRNDIRREVVALYEKLYG